MKKLMCLFLALTMLLTLCACGKDAEKEQKWEEFDWDVLELSDYLPKPEKCYGELSVDRTDCLSFNLAEVDKAAFKAYREACIEAGYTIDAENTGDVYDAFNTDGYNVRMIYQDWRDEPEISVTLEAPEKMAQFEWPTSGLGSLVPPTTSTLGRVCWDNEKSYIVHVGEMSIEQFNSYVKSCEDAGFVLERSRGEESYSALNEDGYKVHLMYLGWNCIEVSVKAPEGGQKTDEPENTTADVSEELVDGMRPEFKEAMDAYEAFYDEYCEFLKAYEKNPTDYKLLLEYSQMMQKSVEMNEKFAEWDESEMNDAEMKYYLEVTARVNKKLAGVAYA